MKKLGILTLLFCVSPMVYAQAVGSAVVKSSDVEMTLNSAAKGTVIASGSCGENVNYELYDDYTLRIFGKGAMYNYKNNCDNSANKDVTSAPWGAKIKAVVIDDGVTRIGALAFLGCSSLSEVTIPNSVTCIGKDAFDGCSALTKINIHNSVIFIEDGALGNCNSLVEVNLSSNIKTISSFLLKNCGSIENIKIPNSVTSIERYAFEGCSSLKEIKIPNSVTNIEDHAFSGCDKMKYITFGESVKNISIQAFPQNNDEDLVIEITSETPAALRGGQMHSVSSALSMCQKTRLKLISMLSFGRIMQIRLSQRNIQQE